jgi:hypothetical protein
LTRRRPPPVTHTDALFANQSQSILMISWHCWLRRKYWSNHQMVGQGHVMPISRPIKWLLPAAFQPINAGSRSRRLAKSIPTTTLRDLRDRALIATLTYSFARITAAVLPVLTTGVKKVFHELYLSFVSSQPFFGEMISLSLETGSGNLSRFWEVYSYIFNDRSNRSFVIGNKILIIKG